MTLRELQYFIKVYQHTSIAKAAEQLFVAPSVVSNAIKKLESEFNVMLFSRSANYLQPTAKGDVFYEHALAVMANVSELEYVMKLDDNETKKITCNIGVSMNIVSLCGDELYDELSNNFPEYDFVITIYPSLKDPDFYMEYDIIIAQTFLGGSFQILNNMNEGWAVEHLHSFRGYVWLAASSPLCAYPIITYEMLKEYRFVIYNNHMIFRENEAHPFKHEQVINIKAKNQFIKTIENSKSFVVDMPFAHGKLQYEDLFKDHSIALKQLDDRCAVEIIYKKQYGEKMIPLISLVLTRTLFS